MRHELLTRDELAERFGVDVRSITNWVQDGMPQRRRSGQVMYSWQECRDWREQRVREDARATRHAGDDPDRKLEMAELRLRELRAQVEQAEADAAERRAEIVTVGFMADEFRRMGGAIRETLLNIPASWPGPLAIATTNAERAMILRDLVNEILPSLGRVADDDGEGEAAKKGQISEGEDDEPAAAS